jgi:hypothetical protein
MDENKNQIVKDFYELFRKSYDNYDYREINIRNKINERINTLDKTNSNIRKTKSFLVKTFNTSFQFISSSSKKIYTLKNQKSVSISKSGITIQKYKNSKILESYDELLWLVDEKDSVKLALEENVPYTTKFKIQEFETFINIVEEFRKDLSDTSIEYEVPNVCIINESYKTGFENLDITKLRAKIYESGDSEASYKEYNQLSCSGVYFIYNRNGSEETHSVEEKDFKLFAYILGDIDFMKLNIYIMSTLEDNLQRRLELIEKIKTNFGKYLMINSI